MWLYRIIEVVLASTGTFKTTLMAAAGNVETCYHSLQMSNLAFQFGKLNFENENFMDNQKNTKIAISFKIYTHRYSMY